MLQAVPLDYVISLHYVAFSLLCLPADRAPHTAGRVGVGSRAERPQTVADGEAVPKDRQAVQGGAKLQLHVCHHIWAQPHRRLPSQTGIANEKLIST